MFPHLQSQHAHTAQSTQPQQQQHASSPPPSRGRQFRQRSRSFDAAFVAQLHAFHVQQQALNKQTQYQQHQQLQQQMMMAAAAMSMPQYAMAMQPITMTSPPVSPRPTPNRERQLRSAYLSSSGLQPPSSPRPVSPPSAASSSTASASASHNNSRYNSPRAARGQLLHASPPPGSMQSGAVAGYPGGPSNSMPLFPMQPLLFPGLVPPHQLLQQTQLLQLQHQQLMQHMQMQQAASGRPFYGFINVGASSPRPGPPPPPPPPPAAAPPSTAPAAPYHSAAAAAPLFHSPLVAASVAPPKKPRILHVHPTVAGENHARSIRRPSPHVHAHRSMLELHNEYVEVIYTDATRGLPHLPSASAAQRKKQKKARAAALATAAEAEAAAASAAVVPEAPPLTTEEKKVFARLASAAMLAEIQARRDKLNARMKGREAAALQRITEQEAERTRAAEAEKAKERALQAAKAKQREAMAESALSRAKQAEQSKARSALLDEIEAKAAERESKALARLKAQQGSASLFNPTLAYALKVESSHHRGDARSPRKGDITRQRGSVIAHPGFSADKPAQAHANTNANGNAHARKSSLYDGMDIDMMHSLDGSAASSAGAPAASAAAEDADVVHEEDGDDVIDEEGEGDGPDDGGGGGGGDEDHEEESKQELSVSVSQPHAGGPAQHHSPTHKDSAAASTLGVTTPKPSASPRPKHGRSLSSIAKEHIASQLTKISSKEHRASVKLQRLRTLTKARAQAAQAEKQRKMDEIRLAREAELRRMSQALKVMEASTAGGAKVESQFVLAMPLAKAAKAGDLLAIEELSRDKNETGGDIISWVNRHDSAGSTAIFHATWMAHGPVLQLLFNLGARPNHVNNRQNTALHLACDRAHYPIVKLLLERGADPSLRNHEHNACYEMQSRNSAESLEMALYIRQCLEDLILVQSGIGEAAEGVGLGMASVNEDYTPGGKAAVAAAAQAKEAANAAVAASQQSSAGADPSAVDPARESRVRLLASAVSSSPALSLPHSYLDSINAYISKRLHLTASLRRVKLKIWSAVRVKLRLGAFSTMAKERALEAQQEAERQATKALAAEAAANASGQHSEAEQEEEQTEQQEEKTAQSENPAAATATG